MHGPNDEMWTVSGESGRPSKGNGQKSESGRSKRQKVDGPIERKWTVQETESKRSINMKSGRSRRQRIRLILFQSDDVIQPRSYSDS